jgi:hypothetical protein
MSKPLKWFFILVVLLIGMVVLIKLLTHDVIIVKSINSKLNNVNLSGVVFLPAWSCLGS